MDGTRFDSWTRSLGDEGRSRRHVVHTFVVGGLALLLNPTDDVGAIPRHRRESKQCKRGRKRCGPKCCPRGKTCCRKKCVNLRRDKNNCGQCGRKCNAGRPDCVRGTCAASMCPANARFCAAGNTNCGPRCGCSTANDGRTSCSDCAWCLDPLCISDADCVARGLPAGTVCGDGTGEFCPGCTKVCLTPCGSCTDCECFQV